MKRCKYPDCHRRLKPHNASGFCADHNTKTAIRKTLAETPEKRVVIAGVDAGSNSNGSHASRQVSLPREPWA